MNILELLLLITFVLGLLFFLLSITFLVYFLLQIQRHKLLSKEKTKRKSKRRQQKIELLSITKHKKRALLLLITCLFLGLVSSASYFFINHYQSVNLSQTDQEEVVKAYYLLIDLEEQLENAKNGEIEPDRLSTNLQNLGGSMSSYANVRASEINKKEGQIILNRYYNVVKDIGVNVTGQAFEFLDNKSLIDDFLEDIKKAKLYENEVFQFYQVDENNLKKNS